MSAGAQRMRELVADGLDFDRGVLRDRHRGNGVLRGLADAGCRVPGAGCRVPEQVKINGFDNIREGEFLVPSIPTIETRGLRRSREESGSSFSTVIRESTEG
ncbi:hypothetical protein AB0F17_21845 [Nonomuraea sp. NPDC026600]|uniref:hypothetical protein n=1 Tax=Nonomuraea sp. NPDC026600 TaxID=3155363 RepID=UPI0033CF31DE